MPNIRRRFMAALGFFLGSFAFTLAPALVAEELNSTAQPFVTASFQGDYALVGTFGANVARLIGTYHADGRGNLNGTSKVNMPGAGTERVVVSLTMEGTYTVNEGGTGITYITVTFPNGRTSNVTGDFVITKAQVIDGVKIATETISAQREPSPVVGGQFVTHVSTRRPDILQDR